MNTRSPEQQSWVVLKFGGTSVSGLAQWQRIAELAVQRTQAGDQVLLVCSAVAGVTDLLQQMANQPHDTSLLGTLLDRHRSLAIELGVDADEYLQQASQRVESAVHILKQSADPATTASLLATGEWLSTQIGCRYLDQRMEVAWVDACEALEAINEPGLSEKRCWLSARCAPGSDPELAGNWKDLAPVVITQGFTVRTANGGLALLGRGGSDTAAALLASRLSARLVEIWTDVPGLFSADPRLIPQARLIQQLAYREALEMAASGAKVVHPACIRVAAEAGIPVQVRDAARPDLPGTCITFYGPALEGSIKAVTCQREMAVLLLENLDTRQEVGFLARVFDVFRTRGLSIDLVATSETTTTVAFNKRLNHINHHELQELVESLGQYCKVRCFDPAVCVNLVGSGVRTVLSRFQRAMGFFQSEKLLMLSQSANDLCLSMLVMPENAEQLVADLHRTLIEEQADMENQEVFADTWQSLERG